MSSLEEETQKPDWKQWWPCYGIYQILTDFGSGKPTIIDDFLSIKFYGSAVEQGTSLMCIVLPGINYLIKRIIS